MALRSLFVAAAACAAALVSACGGTNQERVSALADYLIEERAMTQRVQDPAALTDSIEALRTRHGIDPASSVERLNGAPGQWLELLRELKRGS